MSAYSELECSRGSVDEDTALLNTADRICNKTNEGEIRPMTWRDLGTATEAMYSAFADDPIQRYFKYTPDAKNFALLEWRKKLMMRLIIARAIPPRRGFTINAQAFGTFSPPPETHPDRGGAVSWVIRVFSYVMRATNIILTHEQRERQREYEAKLETIKKQTISGRQDSMMLLENLFTVPEAQGHGYGTRLIKYITDQADAQSRATWLVSSNVANTQFYESCGFITVGELTLGEDNPTWTETPIIVHLMVRESIESQLCEKLPVV